MARLTDRLGRWLRHAGTGQRVGSWLGAAYIRLVYRTTRWTMEGAAAYAEASRPDSTVIAVFWHGRLFLSPFWVPEGRRAVAMISNNRDGELISAIVARFGVAAVRGSTYDRAKNRDKGGAEAFQSAITALTSGGGMVGITPDGPRGPRMRAHPGAAALAVATGARVVPLAFSTNRGTGLRSWDRFLLPWPFGRGVQVCGPLLDPPEDDRPDSVAAFTARIEAALIEATNRADDLCGRTRVNPAPRADTG